MKTDITNALVRFITISLGILMSLLAYNNNLFAAWIVAILFSISCIIDTAKDSK